MKLSELPAEFQAITDQLTAADTRLAEARTEIIDALQSIIDNFELPEAVVSALNGVQTKVTQVKTSADAVADIIPDEPVV